MLQGTILYPAEFEKDANILGSAISWLGSKGGSAISWLGSKGATLGTSIGRYGKSLLNDGATEVRATVGNKLTRYGQNIRNVGLKAADNPKGFVSSAGRGIADTMWGSTKTPGLLRKGSTYAGMGTGLGAGYLMFGGNGSNNNSGNTVGNS